MEKKISRLDESTKKSSDLNRHASEKQNVLGCAQTPIHLTIIGMLFASMKEEARVRLFNMASLYQEIIKRFLIHGHLKNKTGTRTPELKQAAQVN